MTNKIYIDLDVVTKLMGELPDRVIAQAKTLEELQVAEIEAMNGYMGHTFREELTESEYLDWFVDNELGDETFNASTDYKSAYKELADSIRIDEVGGYFVAINKYA